MKLLKPTYLLRTLLLLCAVAVVSSACERNETQSLSDKLDHMIANRQVYDCQKEQRIAELRHLLSVSGLTPAQEYEINDRLFGEFHKYKLDSAIRYMERNVLLARRLGDRRKGCLSGIRLAELYSSTGMSIEAKRMLDSIDRRSVPATCWRPITRLTTVSTSNTWLSADRDTSASWRNAIRIR